MAYENIVVEKKAGVARIIINRPPLNILNIETIEEMNQALMEIKTDDTVKVVVLTAAGNKAFSAGVEVADHIGDRLPCMVAVFSRLFILLVEQMSVVRPARTPPREMAADWLSPFGIATRGWRVPWSGLGSTSMDPRSC